MKKITLLMLSMFMLSVFSCKKDKDENSNNNNNGGTTATCKVKTMTEDDGTVNTYTYDASGKITKHVADDGTDVTTTTYTYSGKKVTLDDGSGMLQYYILNANGLADSVVVSFPPLVDIRGAVKYNAQGQGISMVLSGSIFGTSMDQSSTMEYASGNMSKIITDDGTDVTTTTYTYFMDKVNKSKAFEQATEFMNANANLMKTQVDDAGTSISYTYELNTDGYVTKSTLNDGTDNFITLFAWDCK